MKKLLISLTALTLSLLVFTACDLFGQEEEACNHANTVTIEAKQATCTEPAYRAGEKCADCGYIIKAPVPTGTALGHVEKAIQGIPVSCERNGITASVMCDYCGEMVVPAETIPKLGHKYVAAPDVPATCTEAGLTGGEICEYCHNYNPDENKKPTVTPPLGHDIEITQEAEAATCKTTGKTTGYACKREGCGYVSESVEISIDPNNHVNVETLAGEAASCEGDGKTGLTEGKTCNDCGVTFVPQEEIPIPEHNYQNWTTSEDDPCVEVGTCVCGKTDTCDSHNWGEWTVTVKPTETSPGQKTRVCENDGCDEESTEEIPAGTVTDNPGTIDPESPT